ncbi:hypothetical protein BJ085DRAFT_31894 [Dimargaris cristalligena]|uniref:Uncharacterized protein n=1 Tax=Dimargaris cristalligena TaxID=215637 RepID=A0A4P9ZP36_9FUNG|nr:hypothetical protein BJ085DRAFT_31894 [Dimargaris cristalligena]|eukprot:RKP34312.1 hypothetical protein BJ085DRAFT_31894 [Dimargaris cristalligena]
MSDRNSPYYYNYPNGGNRQISYNQQSGSGASSQGSPTSSIYNIPPSSTYRPPPSLAYSQSSTSGGSSSFPYTNSHLPPPDMRTIYPSNTSQQSSPYLSNPSMPDTSFWSDPFPGLNPSQLTQYSLPESHVDPFTNQVADSNGPDQHRSLGNLFTRSFSSPTTVHIRQSYSQSSAQPVRPNSATHPPFYYSPSSSQPMRSNSVSTVTTQLKNWSIQDSNSGDMSDDDH